MGTRVRSAAITIVLALGVGCGGTLAGLPFKLAQAQDQVTSPPPDQTSSSTDQNGTPVDQSAAPEGAQPSDTAAQQSDDATDSEEASEAVETDSEPAFSEEELDDLVAPIALYPDALLAQVLVAATYPLDIVKAQRWGEANEALEGEERANAAQEEGWDPSIVVLSAGFPTVIDRMAEEIDWTEQLGNAVIAQQDDVLDAVQRQRARAAAVGNLESNDAQTVSTDDDEITITPAQPEVVYVPQYNPQMVYTQPAPSQPVVVQEEDDTRYTGGEMVATGVIAFGAGMLVNEVFNDDDDWDDYWRGPPPMNWGGGGMYARPGVNVGGDVNINVDRGINNNRRSQAWQPTPSQKRQARENIDERKSVTRTSASSRPARAAPSKSSRNAADVNSKLSARSGGDHSVKKPAARDTQLKSKAPKKDSAFSGHDRGLTETKKASDRGKVSSAKAKTNASARPAAHPATERTRVSKPPAGVAPKAKGPSSSSVFEKKQDGKRADAAKSRGAAGTAGRQRRR
jgi:hypothetical protein